jgi:hypothetical protein
MQILQWLPRPVRICGWRWNMLAALVMQQLAQRFSETTRPSTGTRARFVALDQFAHGWTGPKPQLAQAD